MSELITKDMTIGEIVAKYPETAQIMLNYGLHCVGCHVNAFETLEQGILGHGYPEEMLNKMLDEMNTSINETTDKKTIKLDDASVLKINDLLRSEGKEGWGLRVSIEFHETISYQLAFEERKNDDDVLFEDAGIKIFVDPQSAKFLHNLFIAYVESEEGAGFKVEEMKS